MFIKALYLIAVVVFALGLGLLIFGTLGSTEVAFFGVILYPHLAKGVGIIAMIFSVIMVLAVFGSSQPPRHVRDRR